MSESGWVGDSSETASNKYDPNAFYTASRDRKGFATTIKVNLPPSALAELAALVASRQIPEYRTTADFVRDALVHRIHHVNEYLKNGGEPTELGRVFLHLAEGEHMQQRRKALEEVIKTCQDLAQNAVSGPLRAAALEYCKGVREDVSDPYFRAQVDTVIARLSF